YIGLPSSHCLFSIISPRPCPFLETSPLSSGTRLSLLCSPRLNLTPDLLPPSAHASSTIPRFPIHSHTLLTSPALNSLSLALTFAFISTTSLTRLHNFSLLFAENSSLKTSSLSCPTLIQLSGASSLLYKAA
ncbi:MAG: hypothetical protein Q9179_005673, partial [Wetmoreana sp. 5 TL-2023]